jgi:predicted membrane chloride channel (bestrophin family)
LGPIWAFRGSVILWFPLLFGILLMLSPLYFYSSIEDIKFSENLAWILWFIIGIFYFFQGNGLKANYIKKNKMFKYLSRVEANNAAGAKEKYHNNKDKLLQKLNKKKMQAHEELRAKEELDSVKQELAEAIQKKSQRGLDASKETLVKSKLDKPVSLEQARSSLISKDITVREYENIKIKLAELKEQLKEQDISKKVAKLVQLEKNKKLTNEDNDDDEFYLIATKEVEGSNRNEALWAKCMATQMGDNTKAKYCYVNKRVESLKQEVEDKAEYRIMLDAKIRLEVYLSIERNISSASDKPEYDLASDNLFPNSPNDFYREKFTSQFKEKVKERLEKEIKARVLVSK